MLLAFTGCSMNIHLTDHWVQWSSFETTATSEAKVLTLDCPVEAERVTAHLRANGSAGAIAFVLCDPTGVERHRSLVTAGSCDMTQQWPVAVGTWSLRVLPEDFVGSYSVEVRANDEPYRLQVEVAGDAPR